MHFKNQIVEDIFRRFKWTRNNTLALFEKAFENHILDLTIKTQNKFKFKDVLFQFRCITTTTDTYFRKLTKHKNKNFGILIQDGEIIEKEKMNLTVMKKALKDQIKELQEFYKASDGDDILELITIIDHEHLHHGELILLFRANNVDLPDKFKRDWNL